MSNFLEKIKTEKFRKYMKQFAHGYASGDPERAKDLVQQTLLKVIEKKDSFVGDDPSNWAVQIMKNISRDSFKKKGEFPLIDGSEENLADPMNIEEEIINQEENINRQSRFNYCMKNLKDLDRELIIYKHNMEMSYGDISEKVNLTVSNVKIKISRAKESLRICINQGEA